VAEEEALPFADSSFDRILLVHGLEAADNARRLLREAWRVLRDDGRLMIVVPNRTGIWAHLERTPFGHGHPYSAGQLSRLLARHLFRVERREAALFLPPLGLRYQRATAPALERAGRALCPRFAGITIMEAEKDFFAAMPAGAVVARRRVVAAQVS
jgi:SAM-dependent methyltransferase